MLQIVEPELQEPSIAVRVPSLVGELRRLYKILAARDLEGPTGTYLASELRVSSVVSAREASYPAGAVGRS